MRRLLARIRAWWRQSAPQDIEDACVTLSVTIDQHI